MPVVAAADSALDELLAEASEKQQDCATWDAPEQGAYKVL